jgi:hypothetical protein
LLCVFTCFWDSRLFQTLAPQGEPAPGRLRNKSCLKTYRRFFVRSGMCLNDPVKVEMTGRDEGCERRAALRVEALLSAPPTTALQSESCGSKRRPVSVPSRRRDANRCNFDESRCNPTQPDCNSRRGIAPNCTKLHQIAVAPKNQKGENQAGRKVPCSYLFASILLSAKWRRRPASWP